MRMGSRWTLPSKRPKPSFIVFALAEQRKLRWIARRGYEPQMRECRRGETTPPRRALHETLLQKERFHSFLDRVARFAERRRNGFDADWSSAEGLGNEPKITFVEGIETARIHFQPRERLVGELRIDACTSGD